MTQSMYEVDTISYLNYIQNRNIKLPRFQRQDVWNTTKQFALMISLFKGYPIGVVVLNEEKSNHPKKGIISTSWLLDGRQRRTALVSAYNNPENIYEWSIKFLKLKNTFHPDEVRDRFWKVLEQHLEQENDDNAENDDFLSSNRQIHFDDDFEDGDKLEVLDDEDVESEELPIHEDYPYNLSLRQDVGLNMLLEIILICHKKESKKTSYVKPFNFKPYFKVVPFIDHSENVNAEKLTKFIREFIDANNDREYSKADFISFCENTLVLLEDYKKKFRELIDYDWKKISQTIDSVWDLTTRFEQGKMPLIRLNTVKSSDSQNIFKFINSSGTPLNAVEILSAKPSWNRSVKNVSEDLKLSIERLYSVLGVKADGVVRWDVAATLLDRLNKLNFIFKPLDYSSTTEFKTKITLGFKLLAGLYEKGINKENLSNLSKNQDVKWNEIDTLINEFNTMGKILLKSPFFKTLSSWNTSLMGITSEAIAINFSLLLYKEWKESTSQSTFSENQFIKKAISLFDRSVYEYVTRKWRGSSDAKISDNILNFNQVATFDPVKEETWLQLIEQLIDDNTIDSISAKIGETKSILYYYYILSTVQGPGYGEKVDVDHIIPQEQFAKGVGIDKTLNKDNITNLCLLNSEANNFKRARTLAEIILNINSDNNNKFYIKDIIQSVGIELEQLKDINTPNDLKELKKLRKPIILNAFSKLRIQYLQK